MIRHIYQHLFDCGYLKRGDTVLDPFAGVALGALHAMQWGLHWVGKELEQKFVDLGQQNIDLWNARFGPHLPNWGSAVLLQGDSRYLLDVVGGAKGLISSPPYTSNALGHSRGKAREQRELTGEFTQGHTQGQIRQSYSTNPANLGNMPAGDPGDGHGVDAVIGSPPYAESAGVGLSESFAAHRASTGRDNTTASVRKMQDGYGQTPGQLAAMPPGQVADGLVSSPPYAGSAVEKNSTGIDLEKQYQTYRASGGRQSWEAFQKTQERHSQGYGNSDGQLGQESGTTFWSAARLILQQCYHVLKPGAVAVWVVKRFVRDKQIVPFSQQWADLCQSCGFELLHWHRAMLVEDGGTQLGLLGDDKRKVKKRYSFFRRLHAQKYPHLEIEWEDVLCTIRR